MDWSDEPYVRLYTRDTTNWRRFGWEGQAVLSLLLRKVDRAGVLDLSELEPWEAVALAIGMPEEIVQTGVARLLKLGTLAVRGDQLVIPNHLAAQTSTKSDKLRQKESRERRAMGSDAPVTKRDDESRAVTAPSRELEPGHAPSHPVTSGHSLLCSAVLSNAVQSERRARGQVDFERLVRVEFAKRYEIENPSAGLWNGAGDPGVGLLAAWLSSLQGEPEANLARTLDGFFGDAWARSKHFPIGHLGRNAARYFEPREAPTLAKATPEQRLAELDRLQRERMAAGDFGPEYQALCDEAVRLRKDLDPPTRGGEPRRAFGR